MPDVLKDEVGLVGSVNKAAQEKGRDQDQSIVQLNRRARLAEFVQEPVDVEERSRELPKNKVARIEVREGPLRSASARKSKNREGTERGLGGRGGTVGRGGPEGRRLLTKPSE